MFERWRTGSVMLRSMRYSTRYRCCPVDPRRVEDLPGGLTNRNVKITTADGGVYVARCSGPSSDLLGIDRDAEFHNSVAAHRAGVGGAPVWDYRPDLGVLLIGYLEGDALRDTDFARPGWWRRSRRAAGNCTPGRGSAMTSTCSRCRPAI